VQVPLTASTADSNYTDKPIPNAFWRAFSALIYLIPAMDSIQLGVTTYGIVPQSALLFQIGGALYYRLPQSCSRDGKRVLVHAHLYHRSCVLIASVPELGNRSGVINAATCSHECWLSAAQACMYRLGNELLGGGAAYAQL
jgi:hypothetical protein